MVLQEASADLGALSVKHDGAVFVGPLLEGVAEVGHRATVGLDKEERGERGEGHLPGGRRERS